MIKRMQLWAKRAVLTLMCAVFFMPATPAYATDVPAIEMATMAINGVAESPEAEVDMTGVADEAAPVASVDIGVGAEGSIPEQPAPSVLVTQTEIPPSNAGGVKAVENAASGEVPAVQAESGASVGVVAAPELPTAPILITAYKATGAHLHAVQLYNTSSAPVSLEGWELTYVTAGTAGQEYTIKLGEGFLLGGGYMVMAWRGEERHADMEFEVVDASMHGATLSELIVKHGNYSPVVVDVPTSANASLMQRTRTAAGNHTAGTKGYAANDQPIRGGGLYHLPDTPTVAVREIMVNPGDCTIEFENDASCYDYIKLRNTGEYPVDLSLYRVRSGFVNTASTSANTTYLVGVLGAGETQTFNYGRDSGRISFAANDGSVWLEDLHGFESYNLNVAPYAGSHLAAQKGRAWAYDDKDKGWKWAIPSPGKADNVFLVESPGMGGGEVPLNPDCGIGRERNPETGRCRNIPTPTLQTPCKVGQERNPDTGRCRNIATSTGSLTPCKPGQERNPETNRCRAVAGASTSLTPCKPGQERNPETNRCRAIASASTSLKPCPEGQQRNPETNRCRKVQSDSVPAAGYAVEKVDQPPEQQLVTWLVVGGVASIALAYAAWEWRRELGAGLAKMRTAVTFGKR